MNKIALLLIVLMSLSNTVHAKDWQVDYTQSKIGFMGEQGSDKFMGGFKKFTAQISFDPDHPETGKISVTVDTASAFAGSDDRDEMLPQADWFDTSKFPQAQFTSTAITKTGGGQYVMDATLTIKGVTKNVTLPFTLTQEGDHWHAQGRTILMRNDFTIGQGMFAGENYVKHAVDVGIDIIAK